jgi:hypothetical protein
MYCSVYLDPAETAVSWHLHILLNSNPEEPMYDEINGEPYVKVALS